jgi:hypothetical protein
MGDDKIKRRILEAWTFERRKKEWRPRRTWAEEIKSAMENEGVAGKKRNEKRKTEKNGKRFGGKNHSIAQLPHALHRKREKGISSW